MTRSQSSRPWCAVIQYPGLNPMIFGTAVLPTDARLDEVEAEIVALAQTCFPDGWKLIDLRPGALIFHPEEG